MLRYDRIVRAILRGNLLDEPYRLNVSLTNLCDSRCKTCDIWRVYPERRFDVKRELSAAEFREIFGRLPPSVMWISFTGGEPHSRRDFVEIMESCFSEVRNIALVNVPNNAINARRCVGNWTHLLAIKKRPFVYISVSIDGPEEVHDEVRGVEGNFASALGVVEELRELIARRGNAELGIGVTVSQYNCDRVVPFVREMVNRRIPVKVEAAYSGELYFPGRKGPLPTLQSEAVRTAMAEVYEIAKRQWGWHSFRHYLEHAHFRGALRFLADRSRLVIPCRAARSSFAFDPYGNVNPCFFYLPGLGNLRDHDYDLAKLLAANRKALRDARETIRTERCPRCWLVCNSLESMIDRKLRAPWRPAVPEP